MFGIEARPAALIAAAILHAKQGAEDLGPVLETADALLPWAEGLQLSIMVSSVTYQQGSTPSPQDTKRTPGGNVQLTDTQQVTLSVDPEDSKGQSVSDTLTWTSSDDTVVSLQPATDGKSCLCVAGNPGTGVVVTVSDGTLSATDNFDVVAGDVAQLKISEGTPEAQPAAQ